MIKIGKTIKELDVMAEKYFLEVNSKLNIRTIVKQKLDSAVHHHLADEEKFYREIKSNLKFIIVGKPSILETLSTKLNPLYLALEAYRISRLPVTRTKKTILEIKRTLKSEIFSIFNYEYFTANSDGEWAYEHSLRLGLNVCPYCNNQYTFTIKTPRGKTRPQFDHFFLKSKHPYFAISFYNLIPSCYVCNSNLKGQTEFKPSTHIHPFLEGTEDTIQFKTNVRKVDYLLGKKDFTIVLKTTTLADPEKARRAQKSVNVFHIDEQYAFHKQYAGEIILKAYLYTDTKIDELVNEFHDRNGSKIFSSKEEIVEMIFGNHLREDKLHERVLAKLTKNIANEMGVNV